MGILHEKYRWIELAGMRPGGGMKRNHWVRTDDAEALSAWLRESGNLDVYATVCRFTEPNRSSPYECDFFLDIDAEDLEQARAETLKASDLLMEHLGISQGSLDLFFSGAKGFHVLVPRVVFGEPDYSHVHVLWIWAALARRLVKEGIPHIDLGVYQASRVLRLPNSINSKTGMFKVPLEFKELRDLGLEHVLDVARSPREENSMAVPEESPKASNWLESAVKWCEKREARRAAHPPAKVFREGWRVPPCVRNIETATLPDGIRHEAYFALAKFYGWIGMHPAESAERLHTIDSRHPIHDRKYIERMVRYGAGHPGFVGCQNPALSRFCNRERCFLVGMRYQAGLKR